jgi:hypothetical protein
MIEVLSKTCSSMILPQGTPLLALGLCMPAAVHRIPPTLQRFPRDTIDLCGRGLAASQAHGP